MLILIFISSMMVTVLGLSNLTIPEGFMIGAATSAYQIEGAWNADGKGPGIHDVFYQNPSRTVDGSNGNVACNSYYQFKDDIAAVKMMGLTHYRFSISWPRIMPMGLINNINQKGLDYYNKVINLLLENGIVPVVQMFHYDLPNYLESIGGWTNEALIPYFVDYARVLFENYGDRVKWWSTFNEPVISALGFENNYTGYAPGVNFPGIGPYLAAHAILKAHARTYHLYQDVFRAKQQGYVSITIPVNWALPQDKNSAEDKMAAERYLQFSLGWWAHPIYSEEGDYSQLMKDRIANLSAQQGFSRSRLPTFTPEEVKYIRGTSDYFSLNEYTAFIVTSGDSGQVPSYENDRGTVNNISNAWPTSKTSTWETVVPMSIRDVLDWCKKEYGEKWSYLITENGYADEGGLQDTDRIKYLATYMIEVLKAIHLDNCKVFGYTVWSLIDNFEWGNGYTSKFGLYYVNFTDPGKPRTPKQSAYFLRQVIETWRIPEQYYREAQEIDRLENM